MKRDDNTEKKRQSVRDKENDYPSNTNDRGEGRKNRENPSEGMDEDLDAQEGGSYGHKSQDDAEKDDRR